ncbi:MAG: thiamine-phosphate kinase [Chloroflexi bacterium]|nr:thiamine-phosphate kinase [Chloroflexota bacterium]
MTNDRRVRDIGEFGLIERLSAALPAQVRDGGGLEVGIGDDAAVWQPVAGERVVVTTDSLIENVHFRLDWTDWASLGHKMLAVNISDLAAMGADPKLAFVTLGLRGDERIDDLESLYRGLGALARQHGMIVAGGDVVRSPRAVAFQVTALGNSRRGRVLTRSGANAGDLIGVTGTLGASAAGLRLLALNPTDLRRQAATADRLIEAHLKPEPRVALGTVLLEHGATSAMDLSDGLLGDLPKILSASRVSGRIDERRIPVAAAVRALFADEWIGLAMRGGEDYELLFTAPPGAKAAIERAVQGAGGTATFIGDIVPMESNRPTIEIMGLDNRLRTELPGAFDHFGPAES